MNRLWSQLRIVLFSGAMLALVGAGGGGPRRTTPPSTLGSYPVEFRGGLIGRGNAIVTPLSVNVLALVRDTAGNTANLVAPALPLENGRFDGSGTLAGLPVRVAGRVDPPSDVVPVARITCTLLGPAGETARGIGGKR